MLQGMARGLLQLAQALKSNSLSDIMLALTAMGDLVDKGTPARMALEEALGFALSTEAGDGAGTTAAGQAGAGELGTRANPIPFCQGAEVGSWRVKVAGATLNATELVANHNEFNPGAGGGKQYVLITIV